MSLPSAVWFLINNAQFPILFWWENRESFLKFLILIMVLTFCQISLAGNSCNFDLQKEQRKASQGDHLAQYRLGLKYSKGECVNKNKAEAAKWYKAAAARGNHFARHNLALMLKDGDGISADIPQAIQLLEKNDGFPSSMTTLGLMYVDGIGIKKDSQAGFDLLKGAAEFGEVKAQEALASIYSEGREGILPNIAEASKWYSKAFSWYLKNAQLGDSDAQLSLCQMYRTGKGTAQDISQAFYWCRKASEKGLLQAQIVVGGLLYFHGQELGVLPSDAIKWWNKAADQGDADAFFLLGMAYHSGKVTTKNIEAARYWYTRAAEKGQATAIERLKNLH